MSCVSMKTDHDLMMHGTLSAAIAMVESHEAQEVNQDVHGRRGV